MTRSTPSAMLSCKGNAADAAEAHAEELTLEQEQRKTVPTDRCERGQAGEQGRYLLEAGQGLPGKEECLEAKISGQQGYINRLRGYGYQSSELAQATTRLDQYKDQLGHLQEPIR